MRQRAASHELSPDRVRTLSRTAGNRAVVQLLQRNGIFSPGLKTRPVAAYDEARKSSKKNKFEAEHMMPSAAWKASKLRHRYGDLPAMSISYRMHRGAQAGAGGGVTSTGSSATAQGWAKLLGAKLADPAQREEAFHAVAMDEYNAALMTGMLDEALVSQIVQTLDLHRGMGHLTVEQAGNVQNAILDRWFGDQERSEARDENLAAQALMSLGGGA